MTRARRLGVILLATSGIALPGCLTRECGAVEPLQGLDVEMTVAGGPLQPGAYTIVVDADTLEVTAESTLAADGSSSGHPVEVVDGSMHLDVDAGVWATAGSARVGYREGGGPASITITVEEGGTVLGTQRYTPSYATTWVNGDGCPPPSIAAQDTLTLTAP